MGKITYKIGNLLDCSEKYLAHGCNARNGFGAGVAGAIAKRWPNAKAEYHTVFYKFGLRLGDIIICEFPDVPKGKTLFHAITQDHFLPRDEVNLDYGALRYALKQITKTIGKEPLALPRIGCGLAGGDWEKVEKIIEEEVENPVVYDLEDAKPELDSDGFVKDMGSDW